MPDDPVTPPAGETPTDTPKATPPVALPPPIDEFDPVRAKALIDKLREKERQGDKDAKALRAAEARLAEIEAASLTEQERIAKEREDAIAERDALRARTRADAVKLAVFSAQAEVGLADADLALAALDHAAITFDDAGQPTNVAALLSDLLERKPLLKAAPAAPPRIPATDGGSGSGPAPDLTADELEAAALSDMTPERYAQFKKLAADGRGINVLEASKALLNKQG